MGNQQLESMKDIEGYEGKYAITSTGKVYSYSRNRYLMPKVTKFGYYEVALSNQTDGIRNVKYKTIHRLVAETFLNNPSNLEQVNHKDGNKFNNHLNNLEFCTAKENIKHSWKLGLSTPSRPNLGKNVKNAKSKYRNVIYIGKKKAFRAVLTRIINGKRFTKTKLFNIEKYGYAQAELLAAKAVNEFIDTYPIFQDAPKLDLIRVQRPSEESEYTPSGVETVNILQYVG